MVTDEPGTANPKWSQPRRLCEGVMLNKPTVLAGGDWLFPVNVKKDLSQYQWEDGKEPPTNIVVMATGDQGTTFTRRGAAPVAPEDDHHIFSEPMIVESSSGELWMPVRASYGLGETKSSDQGKTWSPIAPASIKHTGSRFFVRKLQSGNVLLVKHGPIDQRTHRELLTAYVSTDDAATWSDGLMLDQRYHLSYPDGIQAPDGTIYVVYDHGRYPGTPREILMAVFSEADRWRRFRRWRRLWILVEHHRIKRILCLLPLPLLPKRQVVPLCQLLEVERLLGSVPSRLVPRQLFSSSFVSVCSVLPSDRPPRTA